MSTSFGIFKRTSLSISALLLTGTIAQAGELSVIDGQGVPYLRVDAAEGSVFDLKINFNDDVLPTADVDLTLTNKSGDARKFTVKPSDISNGVSVQNVSLDEYVVNTNSNKLSVKNVNVSDSTLASAEPAPGSDTIGTTAYAVGAAALAGGVIAVSAGSDGMDIFGGSNSSRNSSREGSGNSNGGSGASNSVNEPRGVVSVQSFDPNFPTNNAGFSGQPTGSVTFNPPPFAANPNGGGAPAATPTPVPPQDITPAPPITNPMTPS